MKTSAAIIGTVWLLGCASVWRTWSGTGSLYRGPCTHLGVRAAPSDLRSMDRLDDWSGSVHVTTDWPLCGRR